MKRLVLSLVVCAFMAAPVVADLTTIYQASYGPNPPQSYNEKDLAPMPLPELPGNPGGDEPFNGVDDYQPGDVLSQYYMGWTRIDDDGDQLWYDLNGGIEVKAIYTSNPLYLVYSTSETTGAAPVTLDDIGGDNNNKLDVVNEIGSIDIVPNTDAFIWGAAGAGSIKWSNEALNGGTDRMVTYRINKLLDGTIPTTPTWLLGFEDGTDADYHGLSGFGCGSEQCRSRSGCSFAGHPRPGCRGHQIAEACLIDISLLRGFGLFDRVNEGEALFERASPVDSCARLS